MCGIFGIIGNNLNSYNKNFIYNDLEKLIKFSFLRGSDGLGVCLSNNKVFKIYRETRDDKRDFNKNFKDYFFKHVNEIDNPLAIIGQTRLPMIGNNHYNENISPVETEEIIGVHNGNIIFDTLNLQNLEFSEKSDTKILYEKITKIFLDNNDYEKKILEYLMLLEGDFSIVFLLKKVNKIYLSSNTGSLYYQNNLGDKNDILFFTSEKFYLKKFLQKSNLNSGRNYDIQNIKKKMLCIENNSLREVL